LDPENALTYYNRAELKAKKNDFKGAIEDYNKVITINPHNVFTYFNRAIMWQRLGKFKKAIADYTSAINLNPLFATAYYNRSIARSSIKDYAGAEQDYKTAAKLNASLNILSQAGKLDSTGLAKLIEFRADFEEGNVKDIKASQSEMYPFSNFVITYCFKDSVENCASSTNAKIFKLNHDFGDDKFKLTCQDDTLPRDKAEQLMKTLDNIPVSIDNNLKIFERAIIKYKLQNYNGSLDDYNTIISLKPDFGIAYFNRANTRFDMISFMNEMKDYNENIISIGNNKTQAHSAPNTFTKDYDDVIADYKKCIQMEPQFYYFYFNLANVDIDLKDYVAATSNFTKAISIEPKFAEAYYNRGLTYIYIQKKEEGCLDLSKAGELGIQKAYTVIKKFCDN